MDPKAYREQLQRDLEQERRRQETRNTADVQAGPPDDDLDDEGAVTVAADRGQPASVRAAAMAKTSYTPENAETQLDIWLTTLADDTEPVQVRLAALQRLIEASFIPRTFASRRADFLRILQGLIDHPDQELREQAIDVLARNKDERVQQRLIQGLTGQATPLVPALKAIQFLSYDVHDNYFPLLRRIAEGKQESELREAAIRLLAADPASTDLFVNLVNDRSETSDVRSASAVALQAVNPQIFEEQCSKIAMAEDEDEELRATCIGALTHFEDYSKTRDDPQFAEQVRKLGMKSDSKAAQYSTHQYFLKQQKP